MLIKDKKMLNKCFKFCVAMPALAYSFDVYGMNDILAGENISHIRRSNFDSAFANEVQVQPLAPALIQEQEEEKKISARIHSVGMRDVEQYPESKRLEELEKDMARKNAEDLEMLAKQKEMLAIEEGILKKKRKNEEEEKSVLKREDQPYKRIFSVGPSDFKKRQAAEKRERQKRKERALEAKRLEEKKKDDIVDDLKDNAMSLFKA